MDGLAVMDDFAVEFEIADDGAVKPCGFEFGFIEFDRVWLGDSPTDVFNAVIEKGSLNPEFPVVFDETFFFYGVLDDGDVLAVDTAVAEPVEEFFAACRIVAVNRVFYFVEIEAEEHRSEAQAMVTVKMADENAGNAGGRDVGKDELALGSFAWIKEEPLIIPTEQIGAVVAESGLLLAGAAEDS